MKTYLIPYKISILDNVMSFTQQQPFQIRIMELRGTYKGGGGPDKTILLSAKNHDARFFVLATYLRNPRDQEFQIGQKAKELGINNYVEVMDRRMLDLPCLFRLSALLKEYQIQIIHVHDLKSTLLGLLLKVLHPTVKIMHTAHGWIVNTRTDSLKQKLQIWLLRCYPFHIAVSEATKKIMVANGINPRKIKMLYNAIDTEYWQKNGSEPKVREEFGINKGSFIIGSVGRLSPEKDLPTFFQVARIILQSYPDTRFIIAGDGKEDEIAFYRNLAREYEISESVILTGHRADLKNLYASFDLFLMTSLTEGLPNTVLEAMAMRVPVIATRVGGLPELIVDNESGFLCDPGDKDGIAERVVRLLSDETGRGEMAASARKQIVEKFSFDDRLKKIEEYYESLV
ncbi:MAG: glycosyltransferase family 4 protein [bacterium]